MDKTVAQYIRTALDQDLFEIYYQPQFCLAGACYEIIGAESLLRVDTSVCHIDTLIDVAIRTDMVVDLGYYIIEKVARQLRTWLDNNVVTSKFTVSINVAGEQLQDKYFCETVASILENAEIAPEQITLELTESSLIDDRNIAKIYKLVSAGFTVSIDDFGTGYSSLGRLKVLPIQEIKIDKMFVDDITKTDQDVALITALYQLTSALNKFTIVEGVENRCQYNMLREIGFECFQGYFFNKAESAEDFAELFTLVGSLHSRPCLE